MIKTIWMLTSSKGENANLKAWKPFLVHILLVFFGEKKKSVRDHALPEQASSERLVVAKEERNKRNVTF